jgi:hypothetical protein
MKLAALAGLAFTWAAPAQNLSVAERIAGRSFPSVFQAWSRADNLPGEDRLTTMARHDLVFSGPEAFGLRWNNAHVGIADGFLAESVEAGKRLRAALLAKNPHIVLLAEIRYRDAHRRYLPTEHPWWKRSADGKIEAGWEEGGYFKMDFANLEFQQRVAAQARAAVQSGVLDGVMLDWWSDDEARVELVKRVREAVGEQALIIANANDRQTPRTAPHLNGYFMECYRTKTPADWERIAATLAFAERAMRTPRVNCLETWYHNSREDLNLMRATTTLSLTLSGGYVLFSDPNPLPVPDHLHNWYPFWEKSLGKAVAKGSRESDGTIRREFERGTAVYNPFGNQARTLQFSEARRSAATGAVGRTHRMPAGDGDLFLK